MKFGPKNQWLMMLTLAVGLSFLEKVMPQVIYMTFAYPAAAVAGLFFGTQPVVTEASGISIFFGEHAISVIPECSAYGFFCLIYAMIVAFVIHRFRGVQAALFAVGAIAPAYGLTVLVNGSRIVCAHYAHEMGRLLLPDNFQPALHQGVGIVIFLSVLMGIYLWLEGTIRYEFKR